MDKEIALLNRILFHIANMAYKKIDGDMGFMIKISDNPSFLKNKIPEIHKKILHYMDLMTTIHHINQLYMLKNYGEITTYLDSLIPSLEFYNKFFIELSRKSKEKDVKDYSNTNEEIMKLIRITKKKMKELASKKKGSDETADYYAGKITSRDTIIGGEVYTSGYMVDYMIVDLEEKIKNSDMDDEDLIKYINKKLFRNNIDAILSNNITYETLANVLNLDHLYQNILEQYNHTVKKVCKYLDHRQEQYLKTIHDKIEVFGGGLVRIDDICHKIDKQDHDIIDNLIARHIKELNYIRDYDNIIEQYNNVEDICNKGPNNKRIELKNKIHKSYEKLNNINASSMIHQKVSVIADEKNLPKLLLELLVNEKESFIAMEDEYTKAATHLGDIIENLELLIGPDTTYCIMHIYNRYAAYINLQILPIIEKRRFNKEYSGRDSLHSRLMSKVFTNVEFMDVYDNGFLWDNIEKNIDRLIL